MHALDKATTAQRTRIELAVAQLEMDTATITFIHRRIGLSDHWIGKPFAEWLNGLTKSEASMVINKLERLIGR